MLSWVEHEKSFITPGLDLSDNRICRIAVAKKNKQKKKKKNNNNKKTLYMLIFANKYWLFDWLIAYYGIFINWH